jgi:hypothetical protein
MSPRVIALRTARRLRDLAEALDDPRRRIGDGLAQVLEHRLGELAGAVGAVEDLLPAPRAPELERRAGVRGVALATGHLAPP